MTNIKAFVTLKKALTAELQLFQLGPDQPFVMKTDASDIAIGAVLEQYRDGKLIPVAFFSRKLAGSQKKLDPQGKPPGNRQFTQKMGRLDRFSTTFGTDRS